MLSSVGALMWDSLLAAVFCECCHDPSIKRQHLQNTKARRAVVHSSRLLASYYLTDDVVAGSWRANVHIPWIVVEDAPDADLFMFGRFCPCPKS